MLQSIREKTQGWIAGVIVSVICLTFALWGIHSYFVGGGGPKNVATVNKVAITNNDLSLAYDRLRRQVQAETGKLISEKDQAILKKRALQALVELEVLKQSSEKQGFKVFDTQVDNYLQSMPEFQENGEFSLERFQNMLARANMTPGQFLQMIQTSLQVDQPRLGIVLSSIALPGETDNSISLIEQRRDIAYFMVPVKRFLTSSLSVSDADVSAYYNAHKKEFMTPEKVKVEYITLSMKELAKKMKVSDDDLKSFYHDNLNAYTKPRQWKLADVVVPIDDDSSDGDAKALEQAEKIVAAVKKGSTIEAAAKKIAKLDLSDDNLQEKGWLRLNAVPEDLQSTVSDMTEKGGIADPVKTADGYVVVKVLDFSPKAIQSFDKVKAKVKELYQRQHAEEKFAEMRERLADVVFEHPESLQTAAEQFSLKPKVSEAFTRNGKGDPIGKFETVRRVAFSNDVLELNNNSDVVLADPETAVVLRLSAHMPSKLQPLDVVKQQIKDKLRRELAENKAKKTAQTYIDELKAGSALSAIAKDHNYSVKEIQAMGRYSTKVDSTIVNKAFSTPHKSKKTTYALAGMPSGFAVVAVKGVKPGDIKGDKQIKVFSEQFANSEGVLEYELYKLAQMKHAKIKYLD